MLVAMRTGIACLVLAYVLSQFYRAFLAVLSPFLVTDLGLTPEDLAAASGLWFLAFALMQLPVGAALDRKGPRETAALLLAVGGVGAFVFALATGPAAIKVGMILIGIGCSPVLMASYFIFARLYPPAVFGTLAGAVIGFGSLGNIASALPLAWAAEAVGWRQAVAGIGVLTLLVALLIWALVRNPEREIGQSRGSLIELLRMPQLLPIFVMMAVCYAPAACIRGLWIGPYYRDVFGADAGAIGRASLVMGLAMVAGNFAYGPMDRLFGTRKGVILTGNLCVVGCLLVLWAFPATGGWRTLALLAALGFFGASFPLVIAHGRAFLPQHLTGRGVTLMNLFGIGTTGFMQVATGEVFAGAANGTASDPYAAMFLFFAVFLVAGLAIYALSRDRTD
jgi:predicted MFS family arabinose efflux permease